MSQFTVADMFCDAKSSNHCPVKLLWDKANLDTYQSLVCNALSYIELPGTLCTNRTILYQYCALFRFIKSLYT